MSTPVFPINAPRAISEGWVYACKQSYMFTAHVLSSDKKRTYHVRYGIITMTSAAKAYVPKYGWTCTCDAFIFRGKCKHITACVPDKCEWRADQSDYTEPNTDLISLRTVCPLCGSDTIMVEHIKIVKE